jgi:hypothetical protein
VRTAKEFCLGRKMGMIAATPMDEEHRRQSSTNLVITKSNPILVEELHPHFESLKDFVLDAHPATPALIFRSVTLQPGMSRRSRSGPGGEKATINCMVSLPVFNVE